MNDSGTSGNMKVSSRPPTSQGKQPTGKVLTKGKNLNSKKLSHAYKLGTSDGMTFPRYTMSTDIYFGYETNFIYKIWICILF